jgi:hypothetical protein
MTGDLTATSAAKDVDSPMLGIEACGLTADLYFMLLRYGSQHMG